MVSPFLMADSQRGGCGHSHQRMMKIQQSGWCVLLDFSIELLKGDHSELFELEVDAMTQRGSARWRLHSVGRRQMITESPIFAKAESFGVGGQMTE